jgi:chemotaxis protein MotA
MADQAQAATAGVVATAPPAKAKASRRPDIATFAGLIVALMGIVGGLLLEGGAIADIAQYTAALIVLGGTIGAVMVSVPLKTLKGAAGQFARVFFERSMANDALIDELIDYASRARRSGIVSLEREADTVQDPFLRKALNLAVDGTDLQELRRMLELEIALAEHQVEEEAKVFEAAGGYAPTIGIIGAVMGLIQVMKNLSDIDAVGHGIAVAFVATVYGVGVANIVFLPAAAKIKARGHEETQRKELILEGVVGIVEGLNPKLIRSKLEAFAPPKPKKTGKAAPEQG